MSYEDGMPAGSNGRIRGYPARMSERQQLALILQMTSQEMLPGGTRSENTTTTNTSSSRSSSSSASSSTLQQQRGAKGRWSNKNGESPVQTSINRKEDIRVRQILVNGYDINSSRETNDIAGAAGSPSDESATTAPDSSPCSPAEIAVPPASSSSAASAAPSSEQQEQQHPPQQQQQPLFQQHNTQYQQQQRAAGSAAAAAPHVAEESGAPCEMRRTPPQNKVDRSGTGQSGSSPRVTLRLNQVRGTRDEKKGGGAANSRQGGMSAQGQGQMETSSKTPASSASSTNANAVSGSGNTSGNTSASSSGDSGDVYEFKSSKEPTPVRGASSSPNPNPDKEKDGGKPSSGTPGSQASGGNGSNASTTAGGSSTSVGETATTSLTTDETAAVTASPSSKRSFDNDNAEEQDEENRRKKRKDSENAKENTKTNTTGRQSTGRNAAGVSEKCTKSGKQSSGTASGKGNQNASSINADRKSPNTSMASSPKPSTTPGSTSAKTGTSASAESDGEEDRSKCSDSNSAPKVPPLKIVIPQSTASEQEQGNRNGKNTASRSHQLPYVVASSNSNDSTDKDQGQSASGTTSPTEGGSSVKTEDKKDFSGALHGEERSTHHQRVLRSSHRTGNGGNGTTAPKEATPSSGNGSYSNSSPLPVNTSADRSNNSSPQQTRHHSPTPETTGSDASKSSSSESTSMGAATKSSATVEKTEKNADTPGKNQKDSNMEVSDNSSSNTPSNAASNASTSAPPVELHPRKRKMKPSKEAQQAAATAAANEAAEATSAGPEVHPHDQPITNCYQLFLNIRKQIERRRKGLFPVQPKPPQGFKDYLMNRCTYVLAGNAKEPNVNPPVNLHGAMKDLYIEQEKERYHLRMQHVVEKEKLVLSVEQEILRVHGRAARALANQSLPFSVCTILKDEEVYNVITPEQEEKDRNARSRYNGRLFLSWLQDVDDKWEKIKEGMVMRHHNEAESLHAVQRMHWEWKLKEVGLCESKATPQIEDVHVPIVHVSDDFDLLPA